ncbi:MAG: hypothetical protein OEY36_03495 [Gammaproteobacteria bacterium]|nr:hypothetical protein [Gammaproteobacteria bacterium]
MIINKYTYKSRDEAMTVIHRHCKDIDLCVSLFLISKSLRQQISDNGQPLFGEILVTK